ncbi:MAG: hypothetical protein KGS45_06865 [Planctomycetes bacterium]|nr:hypothetical protein [Planctomycetota bacterium]
MENNEHIHPADPAAASVLRLMASRQLLGHIHSWEIPPIADQLLSSGFYSDAIFEISVAKDAPMSDLAPLLGRALQENAVPWPTRQQAAWIVFRFYITRIAESGESPITPLEHISQLVIEFDPEDRWLNVETEFDLTDLIVVRWAFTERHDDYCEATNRTFATKAEHHAALDSLARQYSREWLARHPE